MDIVELATYEQKWWYFTFIFFVLECMSVSQASTRYTLLSSNSLHRTVVEAVSILLSQGLHLFEYINGRNSLAQRLSECNVTTLSRAYRYISLNLWIPKNCTYQLWYNKYRVRSFRIRVILGFLRQPITDEVSIVPYLDISVARADLYAQFSSSLQVVPYPLDSLTMWCLQILW